MNTTSRTCCLPCLVALLVLLGAVPVLAADYPDSAQIRLIGILQENLYNDRFFEAEQWADSLIAHDSDDPFGYLFGAIALVAAMYDAEDNLRADRFFELLDSAEVRALAGVTTSDLRRRAWMFLALGHVGSYRAVYEARFGSKVAAARRGRAAADHYRRGLAADSSVTDLYFGLGLYHYWKSAKAGVLRFLGLVNDDKQKGMEQLQTAAVSSLISRQASRSALIWVQLDRGEADSAIALCREMLARYPGSRSFLWPLAEAYVRSGRHADAAVVYTDLRERLQECPGNYHNLIECDYQLARCYEQLNLSGDCAATAVQASAYLAGIPPETHERQSDRVEYLRNLGE